MKAFFFSRILREKILLLGLILMAAATWFFSAAGRTTRFWRQFNETSIVLDGQNQLLAQKDQVEAEAMAAIKYLDPSKTFDSVRLQAEIDAILRRTGITSNYSVDPVQTERSNQISMNSMPMQIRNADWGTITKFYNELAQKAPYIGIDQFRLTVANFKHSVNMRVSSIEVAK